MNIHFVDSNIFYYHLLQDKEHGASATDILNRIKEGEESATSVIIVSELVSLFEFRILQTQKRRELSQSERNFVKSRFEEAISSFYDLISSLAFLTKLDCNWDDAIKAYRYRTKYRLDFNDALNVAVMERNGIGHLYSFDKAFDKVPWIKREH